jgi:hypothetical protein
VPVYPGPLVIRQPRQAPASWGTEEHSASWGIRTL